MKPQRAVPQPSAILSRPLCRHIYNSGRRCRFSVLPSAKFCLRHIEDQLKANLESDLSRHFGPHPLNFGSASEINQFLCSVARLTIEDRISVRRASVLAYIASLELRTLPAIDHELGYNDEDEIPPRLIFEPQSMETPLSAPPAIEETPTTTGPSPS